MLLVGLAAVLGTGVDVVVMTAIYKQILKY